MPGLISAQLLIIGAYFSSLLRNGANYLISINEQSKFIKYVVLSAFINIIGNYSLVHLGYGINGIAISTVFSSFLLTTLLWFRIYKSFDFDTIKILRSLVELYFPIFIMIIIGRLLLYIFSMPVLELKSSVIILLVALMIYICLLMIIPNYRLKICSIIKKTN